MKKILFIFLLFLIACSSPDRYDMPPVKDMVGECSLFNYPPVNLTKINFIVPMGSVTGEHVAPIDHQYYVDKYVDAEKEIEIYAPADGTVVEMQHMGSFQGDYGGGFDDYRIVIRHDCKLESHFIHIDTLSEKLAKVAPADGEYNSVNVKVKAGEVLGTYKGSVDYNVVDEKIEITLINPENYDEFDKRIHIADPFNYFNADIREKLKAKSLRDEEPEGGMIDDIPGTVIGTWFKENTGGWSGESWDRYWADHLALVYHHLDTDHIIISIGTFKGKARQFGVKGNSPDLTEITPESGVIEYELVDYEPWLNGERWDHETHSYNITVKNYDHVTGVFLLEMIDEETIKVEVFPDKTADEISGFNDPEYYVR